MKFSIKTLSYVTGFSYFGTAKKTNEPNESNEPNELK